MHFIQKIYYNNKPLVLTNDGKEYIRQHAIAQGYQYYIGAFTRHFRLAIQHLDKPGSLGVIIEDISPQSLQKELYALYEPIDAGGGVVQNENGDVLMIYRRGKWDLPKGKCDEGEGIDACALREVSEETGLQKLKLGEKICDTYHIYCQQNQSLLKHTVWYRMKGKSSEPLTPQKEENILEARWIPERNLDHVIYKSYEAIREVLKESGLKW